MSQIYLKKIKLQYSLQKHLLKEFHGLKDVDNLFLTSFLDNFKGKQRTFSATGTF